MVVALNGSEEPEQTGLAPEENATLTPGAGDGIKEMVIPELVAVFVVIQVALEVSIQVITSPFAGDAGM